MTRFALVAVVCLAACDTAEPVLGIHEMSFYDQGSDQPGMHIAANGNLEVRVKHTHDGGATIIDNHFIATLAADGSVSDRHGKVIARFTADGTFTGVDSQREPFMIVDGVLLTNNRRIEIDGRGAVMTDGKPSVPPIRVEGAIDASSRRTALLAMGIAFGSPKDMH